MTLAFCGDDTEKKLPEQDNYNLQLLFSKSPKESKVLSFSLEYNDINIVNVPDAILKPLKTFTQGGEINSFSLEGLVPFQQEILKVEENGNARMSFYGADELMIDGQNVKHMVVFYINGLPIPFVFPSEIKGIKGYSVLTLDKKANVIELNLGEGRKFSIKESVKLEGDAKKLSKLLSLPDKPIKVGESWENSFHKKDSIFGLSSLINLSGKYEIKLDVLKTLEKVKKDLYYIKMHIRLISSGSFEGERSDIKYDATVVGTGMLVLNSKTGLVHSIDIPLKSSSTIDIAKFNLNTSIIKSEIKDATIKMKGNGSIKVSDK